MRPFLTGVLIAAIAMPPGLSAGTITWTDVRHDNQYSDTLDWSCKCVPGSGNDVLIPAGSGDLNVNLSAVLNSLADTNSKVNIQGGNSLTLGTLTNGGAVMLSGGASLVFTSPMNGSATITGTGTVTLSDDGKSQIVGKTGTESLINDVGQTIQGSGTIGHLASFTNNGTLSAGSGHALIVSAPLTNWDGANLIGGTYNVNQNLQLSSLGSKHISALQALASVTIAGPGVLTGDGRTNALAALNAITDSSLTLGTNTSIAPSSGTLTVSTSGTQGLATAALNLANANVNLTGSLVNAVDDFGNSSSVTVSHGNLAVTGAYTQSTSVFSAGFGAQASTVVDSGKLTIGGVFTQDADSAITLSHGSMVTANGLNNAGTITLLDGSQADFRSGGTGTFANLSNGTLTGGTYNLSGNLFYDANSAANGGGLITTLEDSSITLNQGGQMLFGKNGTQGLANLTNINDSSLSLMHSSLNTITPQGGTLTVKGNFGPAQLLLDNSNLTVAGSLSNQSSFATYGTPVPAQVTVQDHGKLTVQGMLTQSAGASTSVATSSTLTANGFTNGGAISVDATSTADFRGGTFTNLSGTTLTGGSYDIAGVLNYAATPKSAGAITTLSGASVTLEGAGVMAYGNGKGTQAFSTLANINDSGLTLTNATALPTITPAGGVLAISSDGASPSSLTLSGTSLSVAGSVTSTGFTNSNVNVVGGSKLTISGSFTQSGANTMVDASTLTVGGAFVQNAGTITSVQDAGRLTAAGLMNNGSSLQVLDTSVADFRGGAFTNLSAGVLSGGGSYTVEGQLLINGGNITSIGSGVSLDLIGQGAVLTGTSKANALTGLTSNAGTLQLDSNSVGSAHLSTPGAFTNSGSVTLNYGTAMTAGGAFTNSGAVSLNGPGSSLAVAGAFVNATSTSLLQVGNAFDVDPTFTSKGFTNDGTLVVGQGSSANVTGGAFTNLSSGGTLSGGGTYAVNGTFTYSGEGIERIAANTSVVLNALVRGTQAEIIDGAGTDALADLHSVAGTLALSGGQSETITPDGGNLVVNQTGLLSIGAGLIYFEGDGLEDLFPLDGTGDLTIDGGIRNNGTVALGDSADGQSTLDLSGNYVQGSSGTLVIDIDQNNGDAYLNAEGEAQLAGTLKVDATAGLMYTQGEEFTILSFGSRSGNFRTLDFGTFGTDNEFTFEEITSTNSIDLEVVSALTPAVMSSEAQVSDGGVQPSTPEPSTWFLLGGGLLAIAWRRKRTAAPMHSSIQ